MAGNGFFRCGSSGTSVSADHGGDAGGILPIWEGKRQKRSLYDNPNKIADMIEKMSPIHPDKYPPVIENSDQDLKDICYQKAHEIYGDTLPEIVEEPSGKGTAFHHLQWLCGHVYHRPEAGVEIQRGRISGWLAGIGRFFFCRHHVGDHRGESSASPLCVPGMPVQRFRFRYCKRIMPVSAAICRTGSLPGVRRKNE